MPQRPHVSNGHFLGGTIRARTPSETLAAIQPLIKQAGITRLANITGLDTLGLPVYTCIRPLSKHLSTSQGKGLTHELAQCSAYMEALEHYFAETIEPDNHNSEIPEDKKISYARLAPGYFSGDKNMLPIEQWTRCTDLHTDQTYYLPTYFLSFDLTAPRVENAVFQKSTTGLSSGNTLEEALCHGLYEVIEREATAHFSQLPPEQQAPFSIKLESIDDTHAQRILAKLTDPNLDIAIHAMPNRFNLPAFEAVIGQRHGFRGLGYYSGYGCHLDAGIALCRALTEAIQSRVTYISGSRDDMFPQDYQRQWKQIDTAGERLFQNRQILPDLNLTAQLTYLKTCLQSHNVQVLFHQHTPTDCPITVTKIVFVEDQA